MVEPHADLQLVVSSVSIGTHVDSDAPANAPSPRTPVVSIDAIASFVDVSSAAVVCMECVDGSPAMK